jgi:hypothetical protein
MTAGLPIFTNTEYLYRETGWEIAFLNLDNVSRLRTERLRLFHSLTVAGTKESLVKEGLQNGTIISLPFRRCDKYTDNREILSNSLNWLPSNINIDVKLLTKGSDFLTYQENTTIFKHAFKYIKDSKRFTIV